MATDKKRVNSGGFWNAHQTHYSQATHDLLKEMMRESKLTNLQQRQVDKTLKNGGHLPLHFRPTSCVKKHLASTKISACNFINPWKHSGGIRSLQTMKEQGAFSESDYVPPRAVGRSAREKDKLANIMAFGEDVDMVHHEQVMRHAKDPVPDRFEELQQEVEDREKFLADMETLGLGNKYRQIIMTEISQKVREMEVIDRKRTQELEDVISRRRLDNCKREGILPLSDVKR